MTEGNEIRVSLFTHDHVITQEGKFGLFYPEKRAAKLLRQPVFIVGI